MYLKRHLNFLGNAETKEIRFHNINDIHRDVVLEVDDFQQVWDYLEFLGEKERSEKEIQSYAEVHKIGHEEMETWNQFLFENQMVYQKKPEVQNKRLANFLGSFHHTDTYGEWNHIFEEQNVLVIGLGTVGAALVDGLLQFGVKNYILIDRDNVEAGNIPHQRLFSRKDMGHSKCLTAEKRIKDVYPDATVIVRQEFIHTLEDLKDLTEQMQLSAVFCCFDQYKADLLNELYYFFSERKIPIYLSGYQVGGSVMAMELTPQMIEDTYHFEQSSPYVIADNSGVGILGDLSAVLMIRLWLHNMGEPWRLEQKKLRYDFFEPQVQYLPKENHAVISEELLLKFAHTQDVEKRTYLKEHVIFPRVLELYRRYLMGDETAYEMIQSMNYQYGLDVLDTEETTKIAYVEKAQSLMIPYRGQNVSVLEFRDAMLKDPNVEEETLKVYNQAIKELVPLAMKALQEKHDKYISYYEDIWKKYRPLKEVLLGLFTRLTKQIYLEEIDYTQYKPYFGENYSKTIEDELNMVRSVDKYNPYLDFSGFIDYSIQHRFLHLVEDGSDLLCVYNPHYGSSDIIIAHRKKWGAILEMVHEIAHGYYFTQMGGKVQEIAPLTAETLSIMSEIQLMEVLQKEHLCKEYLQTILYKFHGRLSGMFAMDVFEEEILKLPEFSIEKIETLRYNLMQNFLEGLSIKNESYSKDNILMSVEHLFTVREPYLYSHAMILAFDLYQRIKEVPSLQMKLNQYLNHCNETHMPDILDFYGSLGIEVNGQFYQNAVDEICTYIAGVQDLMKELE